jgi:hypothetical protein
MTCLYGECITGILGCDCTRAAEQGKACDNCGAELRAGMPDGRQFGWVHADGGMRYCGPVPAADAEDIPVATWHGTTGQRYS